jgi:hypothetical protein
LLKDFSKGKGNSLFFFFFQHFLTFYITSITFYYYSNKKKHYKTKNFHFSIPSILTFFHINQFLLQYQTESETKSYTKQTPSHWVSCVGGMELDCLGDAELVE